MALTRTVEESTGVPGGVYIAKISKLEEDDGQFGAQIKFYFTIVDTLACDQGEPEDWVGEEKWGWCSDKLTPNSKLFKWSKQILGGDLDVGDPIDLGEMIGKSVRITIAENKNGNLSVTDLALHRGNGRKRSKRAEPEPEDDYEDDEDF